MEISKLQIVENEVRILRDDLYAGYYGGNKARKITSIEKKIKIENYNAIVTTGGVQSNHCRVTALMATQNGWKCHLVLHGEKERFEKDNGNAAIIRATNAKVTFVEAKDIAMEMDKAIYDFQKQGLNPYYLYGGGHSFEGTMAYVEAVSELNEYCKKHNWYPDHIILPSGTGSTQAGIIAGLHLNELSNIKVTGISIARSKDRGKEVISELLTELNVTQGYNFDYSNSIHFNDEFLCGGYEKSDTELNELVNIMNENTGIIFDTTYSGKGMYGMSELIKKDKIKGNILFWHTGGIFNYLAKHQK